MPMRRLMVGCLSLVVLFALFLTLCRLTARWSYCQTSSRDVPSPAGRHVGVIERDYCDVGATGSAVDLQVRLRTETRDWLGRAESILLVGMRRYGSTASVRWQDATTVVVDYEPYGEDDYPLYHVGPTEWNGIRVVYNERRRYFPRSFPPSKEEAPTR